MEFTCYTKADMLMTDQTAFMQKSLAGASVSGYVEWDIDQFIRGEKGQKNEFVL